KEGVQQKCPFVFQLQDAEHARQQALYKHNALVEQFVLAQLFEVAKQHVACAGQQPQPDDARNDEWRRVAGDGIGLAAQQLIIKEAPKGLEIEQQRATQQQQQHHYVDYALGHDGAQRHLHRHAAVRGGVLGGVELHLPAVGAAEVAQCRNQQREAQPEIVGRADVVPDARQILPAHGIPHQRARYAKQQRVFKNGEQVLHWWDEWRSG
nr:hypothetical protein [Tanacetum cinerariifolium]